MATLEAIRSEVDPSLFPTWVLAEVDSAACFFCAAYLGRRDAFHLNEAGIRDVYLCDLDREKLNEMQAIYSREWRFECGDAYRIAERLVRRGQQWDLVIADPWSPDAKRLLTKTFPMWYALARKFLLIMTPTPWFHEQELPPTIESAKAAIKWFHGLDIDVVALHRNTDWVGGVYWMVVRKHDPRHGVGVDWDHSDDETVTRRVALMLRRYAAAGKRRIEALRWVEIQRPDRGRPRVDCAGVDE